MRTNPLDLPAVVRARVHRERQRRLARHGHLAAVRGGVEPVRLERGLQGRSVRGGRDAADERTGRRTPALPAPFMTGRR